ncbi:DUF1570 domain-containing protein [Myxococcus sp. Y35]|uniref:DUF1570 domain-containing protein n=1 Tax=Pseudomyxococcus flavus TaxID=3115648 RepID=UPI003CE9879A
MSLLFVLMTTQGCATLRPRAECSAHGGDTWHEARSEHFRVWTDLDEDDARDVAVALERTRAMVGLWWGEGSEFNPPGTMDVVVLRRQGALLEFAEPGVAGYVNTSYAYIRPFAVMADGDRQRVPQVIRHELVHYLSRFVLLNQPRWFAEGLAMYLEVSEDRLDDTVQMGLDHPDALNSVRLRGVLPLEKLWAWDVAAPPEHERAHHYASAWAWVHYLLNWQAERFADFQRRLARGEPSKDAWEVAFSGVSVPELERALANVVRGDAEYTIVTRKLPAVSTDVAVRVMGDADVHLTRAWLHLFPGGGALTPEQRREAARLDIVETLRREPGHVGAAVLGASMESDIATKLARARELVAAHPNSAEAWGLLGDALEGDASAAAERGDARRNAVRLAPEEPSLRVALAREYSANGRHGNALAQAVKAAQLAPWSEAVQATLAVATAARGRCDDALVAGERAVDLLHESVSDHQRSAYRAWLSSQISAHCASRPDVPAQVSPGTP